MSDKKETKYTRETLIKSKYFANYNRFFLEAVLREPEYTLRQADKIVKKFMDTKIKNNKE